MEYVTEKGHDVLTIDRTRNANTKQINAAARTKGAASVEILISPMLHIICSIHIFVDMCRDIIHIVVEGYGRWSDETAGMQMPTSSSVAMRL